MKGSEVQKNKTKRQTKNKKKRDHCLESHLKRFSAYFLYLHRHFALVQSATGDMRGSQDTVSLAGGRSMVHKLEFDAENRLRGRLAYEFLFK